MKLADMLSAVNDNLKGIQDSGGRKTATEVRTSNESGSSAYIPCEENLFSGNG